MKVFMVYVLFCDIEKGLECEESHGIYANFGWQLYS
jgi:hypothetical protein